jgi:hypothetical protein
VVRYLRFPPKSVHHLHSWHVPTPPLVKAGVADADASRMPIEKLKFDSELGTFTFRTGARAWHCDLKTYALKNADNPETATQPKDDDGAKAKPKKTDEKNGASVAAEPKKWTHPDQWKHVVKDNNIFLQSKDGDLEVQLSDDASLRCANQSRQRLRSHCNARRRTWARWRLRRPPQERLLHEAPTGHRAAPSQCRVSVVASGEPKGCCLPNRGCRHNRSRLPAETRWTSDCRHPGVRPRVAWFRCPVRPRCR